MVNAPNLHQAPSLDPATEQLVYKLVQSFLTPAQKGECRCHWIDPQKTPILVWKSTKDPNTLVMKIAQQKLIGLARSDKNNELYWKFREFAEEGTPIVPNSPPPTKPSGTTEPQVNLPTAENTAKVELNSAEQSPDPSFSEKELESERSPDTFSTEKGLEQVKKFRAKYGNPNTKEPNGV